MAPHDDDSAAAAAAATVSASTAAAAPAAAADTLSADTASKSHFAFRDSSSKGGGGGGAGSQEDSIATEGGKTSLLAKDEPILSANGAGSVAEAPIGVIKEAGRSGCGGGSLDCGRSDSGTSDGARRAGMVDCGRGDEGSGCVIADCERGDGGSSGGCAGGGDGSQPPFPANRAIDEEEDYEEGNSFSLFFPELCLRCGN